MLSTTSPVTAPPKISVILAAGQPSSCRPTTDRGCKRPFKEPPLTAESGGATRAALLAMRAHRGTGSSNPLPSSGESGELPYCAAGSSRSRRTPRNSVHRFTRLRHHFIPQQTPSASHQGHVVPDCPRLSNPHNSARRTVLPMPARGFLPRDLSDACPRSLPHCQATGRHLIPHRKVPDNRGPFAPPKSVPRSGGVLRPDPASWPAALQPPPRQRCRRSSR